MNLARLRTLLVILCLAALLPACGLCRSVGICPGPGPDQLHKGDPPETAYEKGRKLFAAEEWDDAYDCFQYVWDKYPESELAPDARFYAAECKYGLGKFNAAFERYKEFLRKHPLSPHSPLLERRLYDMGIWTIEEGKNGFLGIFTYSDEGVEMLDYLVAVFPHGDLADDALMQCAIFEFADDRPLDAIDHLQDLVEYHPTSEWVLEARIRLARAYRALNRGTAYDGDALKRALANYNAYIDRIATDPERSREHAETLESARWEAADIRERLGTKALAQAEFYLKTGHPDAARETLRSLVRDYPATAAAERARSQLGLEGEAPSDEPGEPGEQGTIGNGGTR